MNAPVRIDPRARAAWPDLPAALPPGAWVVVTDGTELRVQADGQVEPRPTPWPWTRPSIAAIPTFTTRSHHLEAA